MSDAEQQAFEERARHSSAAFGAWVAQQADKEQRVRHRDAVEHPVHYTSHPSGVECITVTEHMGFCVGNAIKYLWRANLKGDAIEDLKKARWYIDREIKRRGGE